MFKRIPGRDDQEYAKRNVDPDDHLQVERLPPVMPSPAGWPIDGKWIDAYDTKHADACQNELKISETN